MPATGGVSSFAVGASALVLGTVMLGGAVVYDAGAIRVRVREKTPEGSNIRVIVPAVLVPVALKLAPDEKLQKASSDLRPWLPTIKVAAEELARCPDGTFVEVTNSHEKVSIVKRGGSLVIDVDSPGETVHVSFPLKVVSSVVHRFEVIGEPM